LVELLVVIAIIALLAALSLPSFRVARAHALQSACASNLRTLMTAMNLYLADNENKYPYAERVWFDANDNQRILDWTDHLSRYDGRSLTDAAREARWLRRGGQWGTGNMFYKCPAETADLRAFGEDAPRDHYTRTYRINGARRAFDPLDNRPFGIAHNEHSVRTANGITSLRMGTWNASNREQPTAQGHTHRPQACGQDE